MLLKSSKSRFKNCSICLSASPKVAFCIAIFDISLKLPRRIAWLSMPKNSSSIASDKCVQSAAYCETETRVLLEFSNSAGMPDFCRIKAISIFCIRASCSASCTRSIEMVPLLYSSPNLGISADTSMFRIVQIHHSRCSIWKLY